jgi:hypothetical protein
LDFWYPVFYPVSVGAFCAQIQGVSIVEGGRSMDVKDATHWRDMSDEEMCRVIRAEGSTMTAEQVTIEYIRAIRHYRKLYPTYGSQLLSFMVRIDQKNGINTCSCDMH